MLWMMEPNGTGALMCILAYQVIVLALGFAAYAALLVALRTLGLLSHTVCTSDATREQRVKLGGLAPWSTRAEARYGRVVTGDRVPAADEDDDECSRSPPGKQATRVSAFPTSGLGVSRQ
jgi:hypothetical protein